jgi:hypothetical protein
LTFISYSCRKASCPDPTTPVKKTTVDTPVLTTCNSHEKSSPDLLTTLILYLPWSNDLVSGRLQ